MKRGDYNKILDNWLSVFPPEQIYIGFYEDLRNCPKKILSEIFAFIGVSREIDWSIFPYEQVIHAGLNKLMPQEFKVDLEEMYCEEIEKLYLRLGEGVKPWRCH